MTDELKREILELIRDSLIINVSKDSDYYGNYSINVTLSLYIDGKYEKISYGYD